MKSAPTANTVSAGSTPIERMYFAWNEALSHNDAAALLVMELNEEELIQRHCV